MPTPDFLNVHTEWRARGPQVVKFDQTCIGLGLLHPAPLTDISVRHHRTCATILCGQSKQLANDGQQDVQLCSRGNTLCTLFTK